ncbi:MAG: efflux RND transporter periplasmic adaptor subunit [Phycisphaerae bacterium]|nr:efflux RND transporter periplasmic adaptor subunit [Phycisphaerae bacterium]
MSTAEVDTLKSPAISGVRTHPIAAEEMAAPAEVSESTWDHAGSLPKSRRMPLVVAVVLIAAVAGYIGWGKWGKASPLASIQLYTVLPKSFPVILQEKGELDASNSIDIRCELEGHPTIIYLIPEGTQAKKGDVLVELSSDTIVDAIRDGEIKEVTAKAAYEAAVKGLEILQDENASKIRKASLDFDLAKTALDKFTLGDSVQSRQVAQLAMEKAKSVLKRAQDTLTDSKELFRQSFLTRLELDKDEFAVYEANQDLEKAKLALEVLEKYSIPMDLEKAKSVVTEAEKELVRAQKAAAASEAKAVAEVEAKKRELGITQEKLAKLLDQRDKARILAPADGLVVYARGENPWRTENMIEKGATVHERQSLITLPDVSSMKVVVRVHEAQTERLQLGLPASVEIEGFTGRKFSGRISKIAVLADSQNRWMNPNLKEYVTEVLLDGEFTELKPGVTARVEILVAQVENSLAVPIQSVFAKGAEYYVFVERNGSAEPVPIVPGLASNEFVEVKKGLEGGQKVYLAVTDEMKLKLPDAEGGVSAMSPKSRTKKPGISAGPAPPSSDQGGGGSDGDSDRSAGRGSEKGEAKGGSAGPPADRNSVKPQRGPGRPDRGVARPESRPETSEIRK